jgi:hypothetical protein
LGDSIYVRPLIAAAALKRDLYVETPWPEFYADLTITPQYGTRMLRTQMRSVIRQPHEIWGQPPPGGTPIVALGYGPEELRRGDVYTAMADKLAPYCVARAPNWDLPEMGESPIDTEGAPLAVIRPVTRRLEWDNAARNPLPEYISWIAGDLMERGYAVAVVCDLHVGEEWLLGEMPPHHVAFTNGEMTTSQLLATVRDAAVVVGGVGWIVPAGIALQTPTFVVLGGNGGMNRPAALLNKKMRTDRIGFASPPLQCMCIDMEHVCDKTISDLPEQWSSWARSTGLPSFDG